MDIDITDRLSRYKEVTQRFYISSSPHLRPCLNRKILALRFHSIDHKRIPHKPQRTRYVIFCCKASIDKSCTLRDSIHTEYVDYLGKTEKLGGLLVFLNEQTPDTSINSKGRVVRPELMIEGLELGSVGNGV